MKLLKQLFTQNRLWAEQIKAEDPKFFEKLASQPAPEYLWIGCSDSRVPANEIIGLAPGEVFVHRNVANVVVHSDLNVLSTIQYAVENLKVAHIMVVGHYGCGGVNAALEGKRVGLVDNWLRHIRDVRHRHRQLLLSLPDEARADALCELNAIEQVVNVTQTTILQDAWIGGQDVTVHGCVYGLHDGLLQDLGITVKSESGLTDIYNNAIEMVRSRVRQY